MSRKLLYGDDVTTVTRADGILLDNEDMQGRDEVTIEVEIDGTATYDVEARNNPASSWKVVYSDESSNGLFALGVAQQYTINVTAISGTLSWNLL